MSLNLAEKQAVVAEVGEVAQKAQSALSAEYRGLTVAQMNALRVKAREQGVYLRVVKNTLARRAIQGTSFECLQDVLVGPLVLAFSLEDPGAIARLFKDFVKDASYDKLVIKHVAMGNQLLPANDLQKLAELPTKDQALAMLMGVMLAPVEQLARALNDIPGQVVRATNDIPGRAVRVVAAVQRQKEEAAGEAG
ncbi:MAG: 50S ribosomal protein L10 [Candidatus Competibacterales bacterium]